ncbi:hypothetical protein DXT96_08965 [Agrobacterium sp. ICMP 6402]|uniref:hyaluronate lyase N-terminal domain-containing protein n=1 Tax=Agrobacterium sp. ICMP 6402 TaxID=2292443 RepID=UPI0012961D1F|nr:hypothetical protein [Agrobacterium sp. ICMP 6402]MQB09981.1 hypothetical protein [Agrobacterium sp. ICMP 6402]
MTTEIRFRRGTTAQHAAFTGALAEITVDTDKKTAVVHDGATAGGFPLVSSAEIDNMMNTQVYDPQGIEDDAFDRDNHTGQQAISTVAGLQALLDIMGKGYLKGLTLSNNVADATNDIDFAAGVCASESAVAGIMQHAAGTAQLDVAYGAGNGGRFDAAISDGTWHCFVISDGNTISRGFSKSPDPTTQPNYPAGFTRYRRVFSIVRVAGTIKAFDQNGDDVLWKASVNDVTDTSPGTVAKTRTLTVPVGFPVDVRIRVLAVGVNVNFRSVISSLAQNDEAVSNNANAGGLMSGIPNGQVANALTVRTNSGGQIRSRGESASGCELYITTEGYTDGRGKI